MVHNNTVLNQVVRFFKRHSTTGHMYIQFGCSRKK